MRRTIAALLLAALLARPAGAADYIKWVDFDLTLPAMQTALDLDMESRDSEQPLSWIRILALAATCHGSGKLSAAQVCRAADLLRGDKSVEQLLGEQIKTYRYYCDAYDAALGGLVGVYAIRRDGVWKPAYGLKAFSPIAAGYGYSHYDDFGAQRSYGFARRHLGNDLLGAPGTPIVAVEGGVVEAMGWNQYGGWRIGIRSFDHRRYWYYAHLKKDAPFAPGLSQGDTVQAGDVIGFMGRTGYSAKENVNNIEITHLHFGLQLIFDESQKECNSEIWIDVYDLVRLLSTHRSSVRKNPDGTWERIYPYRDLDREELAAG